MAFALKVKNAQRKMSECPYVKHEDEETSTQEPIVTMENNYKRVSNELEEEIKSVDLKEAADAIGGNYDDRNGGGVIRLKMMQSENMRYAKKACSQMTINIVRTHGQRS